MSTPNPTEHGRRLSGLPLTFLLATLAAAVMDFRPSLDLTKPGIESPFTYSFNRASEARQRWGRDYIATFGPYGYLIVTHPVGDLPQRRVAFELARVVLAALGITAFLHSLPAFGAVRRVALATLFAWALALQTTEYRWFGVFFLLAIASVHLGRPWNAITRASAAALAGFLMLVKGSAGGGAVLTTLALGLTGPLRAALPGLAIGLAGIVAGLSTAWLAHQGSLSGLVTNLRFTSEIASGYSSAVSLDPEGGWREVLLFLAFLLVLAAGVAAERSPRVLRSLIACGVPLFVVWKHAFVRHDGFHTAVVLPFGLLVTLVLVSDALARPGSRRGLPILAVGWALLVPIAATVSQRTVLEQLWRPWEREGLAYLRMLPSFGDYHRKAWRMSHRLLEPLVLAEDVRALIGDATIDVYPRQTVFAAANPDLNWSFRPSPTSYSNHRPALDELNARFFASEQRPAYLLWAWESDQTIDERNVLWDEPLTLRTIFESYDVVREEPFLLRAGPRQRFTREEPLGAGEMPWNAWADVPASNGPLLVRAELGSSLMRFAARALFRESPIFLDLRLTSGTVLSYRLAPDNAPSGLWIQPPISGPADVRRVLLGEPPRRLVSAIRFRVGWATRTSGGVRASWLKLR